jgi:ROK family
MSPRRPGRPRRVLVLDVGGSHVKAAFSDGGGEIKIPSGPKFTPEEMVEGLVRRLKGRRYDLVSIGYPGPVLHGRAVAEPPNLGRGWVGFNFEKVLRRPTRILNDAAMQALGSYHGGRMLFLGLGTGLGTAMIVDGKLEPMELGHLPYKKGKTYEDYVGEQGLERLGRKKWQKEVFAVTKALSDALEPDYVVLGGGNVRKLRELPPLSERGDNRNAIVGGVRLWADVDPGPTGGADPTLSRAPTRLSGRKRTRRGAV